MDDRAGAGPSGAVGGRCPPLAPSLPSAEGPGRRRGHAPELVPLAGGGSHTHTELLARPGAGLRGEERRGEEKGGVGGGDPWPGRAGERRGGREGRERGRVSAGLGQFRALRRVPAPLRSFV